MLGYGDDDEAHFEVGLDDLGVEIMKSVAKGDEFSCHAVVFSLSVIGVLRSRVVTCIEMLDKGWSGYVQLFEGTIQEIRWKVGPFLAGFVDCFCFLTN